MHTTVDRPAMEFHAGRYLSGLLAVEGRNAEWLADEAGMSPAEVSRLLACSNMEAALFVHLGEAASPDFMQGLDRLIFANPTA